MNNRNVIVTGGLGYIGSHTVVELLEHGINVVVIDNLSNSELETVARIERITGKSPVFREADLLDKINLQRIFNEYEIDAVMHFASFKSIKDSICFPLMYYENNIQSTINLLDIMDEKGIKKFVFSSSASVYGGKNESPYTEEMSIGACTNPYAITKVVNEQIIVDYAKANKTFSSAILRYFNPIGAHSSGLLGEHSKMEVNNIMPILTQIASGMKPSLTVFGKDYETADGTGVRDYIHIEDIAKGHVAALNYINKRAGVDVFNLGTGRGTTVLELVNTFESVVGKKIPLTFSQRRDGDLGTCYADVTKANSVLGWTAEKDLKDMCRDAWKWQMNYKDLNKKKNG